MAYSVKSYMEKPVHSINGEATITNAAKTMAKKQSDYLIVLISGDPVGIVTDRDFINKVLGGDLDPSTTKVSDIMSKPLITIDPNEDLIKASEVMRQHGIRKLPVVRDEIIYGMLTARSIANKCGAYVDRAIKDIIRWTAPLGV